MIWAVMGLLSLPILLFTGFMFDDPQAGSNRILWAFVLSLGSLPVLSLVSIVGGWSAYSASRQNANPETDRQRRIRSALALLPSASLIGCVTSWWLLDIVCHGNFGCR